MPGGKYLEYIRAGRYVIPVELTFLQAKQLEKNGVEVTTSKWIERRHWKEIKAMLKPAVELVVKFNESGTDKISKSHHVSFGQDVGLGYLILLNKEKCPFVAVLDPKKSYWTDDEEDTEGDENVNVSDFGGRHKNYTPTKCYIKVCVVRKTALQSEDKKKILKELGVKSDDMRNYLQPMGEEKGISSNANSGTGSNTATTSNDINKSKKVLKKKINARRKEANKKHQSSNHSEFELSSSEESLMEIPPTTSHPWSSDSNRNSHDVHKETINQEDRIILDTDYNERNDSNEIDIIESDAVVERLCNFSDSADDVFSNSLFRTWIEDDDEDEDLPELPDIEETDTPQNRGRRNKKPVGARKKTTADRSPAKINSGLPDIDEPNKGGRASKAKRKRNVAIVEPMKPMKSLPNGQMSFEEAIGAYSSPITERKRRGRATSSPTIDRLMNSRSKNSAIEILAEDSDLLPIDPIHPIRPATLTSVDKRRRKDGGEKSPRKRRVKKRVETSRYERLTPSPFDEDQDSEDIPLHSSSDSDSEPEMPVLTKMVSTSDEDVAENDETNDTMTPPLSPSEVPPLDREVTIDLNGGNEMTAEGIILGASEQLVLDDVHGSLVMENLLSNIPQNSQEVEVQNAATSGVTHNVPTPHVYQKRRYASDSDDITSESAYRKTPIIMKMKRKRRKRIAVVSDANTISNTVPCAVTPLPDPSPSGSSQRSAQTQATTILSTSIPLQTEIHQSLNEQSMGTSMPDAFNESIINNTSNGSNVETQEINPTAVPKSEKFEENQSYDSDYANGAFSDGDDDDVLFAGQFQATLHKPAVGSPEERNEETELFSFDRPAAVTFGSQSINNANIFSTTPEPNIAPNTTQSDNNTDEDIEYSFDYALPSISKSKDGPQGAPEVLQTFQTSEIIRISDSPVDVPEEHDDTDALSNLTTYQLMNHPSTLKAGFGFLTKVMSNNLSSADLCNRLVGSDKRKSKKKKQKQDKDLNLMPPPPPKRSASPDICSLNPEKLLKKRKKKKHRSNFSADRSSSPIPGPSSGIRQSFCPQAPDDLDDDETSSGEPFLREFMSRTREPEQLYEPQGDEFDLSQRSHCYLNVFSDYAEKSRHYKKHVKNITELTTTQIREHFNTIKPQIKGIFECSIPSERNKLYLSKYQRHKQRLRGLYLLKPFKKEHGNVLTTCLNEFLVPQHGSRLQYTDYIIYVMLPEAFIRIFALVNDVSYETAEKEMQSGPCYEGPLLES